MKTTVVLPTYNEAENLPSIVPAILQALPEAQVLIVDDGSPDGTGKIADGMAAQNPERIQVVHREKKEGLGRAYLFAFQIALDRGADVILQMDADFSHPPEVLPLLVEALRKNDFALGSRYIPGGGIENWDFRRRLLSRAGNLYARLILSSPIHDLTGGFKAFRRPVLEYLLASPIDCSGYSFQIEMTSRALAAGFRCVEIPFVFTERQVGVSKMSQGIVWEALIKTARLRKELKRIARDKTRESSPALKCKS
ncbi:MAG: polyprenol monophosphomannose synthase [bacterium]